MLIYKYRTIYKKKSRQLSYFGKKCILESKPKRRAEAAHSLDSLLAFCPRGKWHKGLVLQGSLLSFRLDLVQELEGFLQLWVSAPTLRVVWAGG